MAITAQLKKDKWHHAHLLGFDKEHPSDLIVALPDVCLTFNTAYWYIQIRHPDGLYMPLFQAIDLFVLPCSIIEHTLRTPALRLVDEAEELFGHVVTEKGELSLTVKSNTIIAPFTRRFLDGHSYRFRANENLSVCALEISNPVNQTAWTLFNGAGVPIWAAVVGSGDKAVIKFPTPLKISRHEQWSVVPGEPCDATVELRTTMSNIENPPSQNNPAKYTWMEPQIRCPNCKSIVNGVGATQEVVQLGSPTNTALGKPKPKFNQEPLKSTPTSQTVGAVRMIWRVDSCKCQVSQEWAGAFTAEVNRRVNGEKPQPVNELTDVQREIKKKQLEKEITNLYTSLGNMKKLHWDVSEVEKSLVVRVDQLARLLPGNHNKLPTVKLSPGTLTWATKNGLIVPPASEKDKLPSVEAIEQAIKLAGLDLVSPSTALEMLGIDQSKVTGKDPGKVTKDFGYTQSQIVNPDEIVKASQTKGFLPLGKPTVLPTLKTLPESDIPALQAKYGPGLMDKAFKAFETTKLVKEAMGYQQTPKIPPITGVIQTPSGPSKNFVLTDEAIKVQAQKIQQELLAHKHSGAPLSPEAKAFLDEYTKIQEVSGPKQGGPVVSKATTQQWIEKNSKRVGRKITKKKQSE